MDPTLGIIALSLLVKKKETVKRKETSPSATNLEMTKSDEMDATFGRGKFVGKTGSPFIDDPFFNPWAPGGSFNK